MARLHQHSATEVVSYLMGWNDNYKMHSCISHSVHPNTLLCIFFFFTAFCNRQFAVFTLSSISTRSFSLLLSRNSSLFVRQHKIVVQVT